MYGLQPSALLGQDFLILLLPRFSAQVRIRDWKEEQGGRLLFLHPATLTLAEAKWLGRHLKGRTAHPNLFLDQTTPWPLAPETDAATVSRCRPDAKKGRKVGPGVLGTWVLTFYRTPTIVWPLRASVRWGHWTWSPSSSDPLALWPTSLIRH